MSENEWRKKPVVVEAMKLDGRTVRVAEWMAEHGCVFRSVTDDTDSTLDVLFISTLEGEMRADPGDYIIRGVRGEFYPCKPDIFEATYERPGQPTEPARVLPSRADVSNLLFTLYDHGTRPNAMQEAHAILALFADQPTVEQVKAGALREAADDWYDHDDTGHWEPMATDGQSLVLCRDDEEGRAWLRARADRLAGGGSDA